MKTSTDAAMNIAAPPGSPAIARASCPEKPDCVSAHAMLVAAPMMSRIAPDNAAVSISMGFKRIQSKRR